MDVHFEPFVITRDPQTINDLPDELLLIILSHLGSEDLCLINAEVCERFNALAKDALRKTISYRCNRSSDINRITEVLTLAPALQSLIVCDRKDAADILQYLFQIPSGLRYLRKLCLEFCSLGWGSPGLLANIVEKYPDLEVLSLAGCRALTSAGYHLIPRLSRLSELDLSYCSRLSGETVCLIADSCQHLKKLSLHDVPLIDEDVIHVINKLGKQLTTLHLCGSDLTDVAYSFLNKCARLQGLEIWNCKNMTDRGLQDGIGSLQELTNFWVIGCKKLTPQTWSTFLHRPSMSSMVFLDLTGCDNLDDEGLKGIAERCIHLEELTIIGPCNVTNAGISMVENQCNRLRKLDVRGLN